MCVKSRVTRLAEFSTFGRLCFLWAIFRKQQKKSKFFATFFLGKSFAFILTKNGLGYTLGDFFRKLIWSP
jgi:hypothetical protein